MAKTPDYYRAGPDIDLFDVFAYRYGRETVQAHLEMAAIEYLYRAGLKGQYQADLQKLGPILDRLLMWGAEADLSATFTPAEREQMLHDIVRHGVLPAEDEARLRATLAAREAVTGATIDDALHVLAEHGWGAVPPPAPQAPNGTAVSGSTLPHTPVPETVLAHCCRVDDLRQGIAVHSEIAALLAGWRIPAEARYTDWSAELARVSQGRYPVSEEVPTR